MAKNKNQETKNQLSATSKPHSLTQKGSPKALIDMEPQERLTYLIFQEQNHTEMLRPTHPDEVSKMLQVVAGMIGCPIPEPVVISQYIKILSEYPTDLLDLSQTAVIKTHKWNNFPKVADFCYHMEELLQMRRRMLQDTQHQLVLWSGREKPKMRSRGAHKGPRHVSEFYETFNQKPPKGTKINTKS